MLPYTLRLECGLTEEVGGDHVAESRNPGGIPELHPDALAAHVDLLGVEPAAHGRDRGGNGRSPHNHRAQVRLANAGAAGKHDWRGQRA